MADVPTISGGNATNDSINDLVTIVGGTEDSITITPSIDNNNDVLQTLLAGDGSIVTLFSSDTVNGNVAPATPNNLMLWTGTNGVTLSNGLDASILNGTTISSILGTDTILSDGTSNITLSGDTGLITTDSVGINPTVVAEGSDSTITSDALDGTEQSVSLDFLHSGNGSATSPLKRMELSYKDTVIKFAINPSDYTQKEPNRATITQTKGGAWIDAWGAGIVEFNIKGITGVSGRKMNSNAPKVIKTVNTVVQAITGNSGVDVGYQRWKELRDLFRQVYQAVQDGEPVTELIKFYNYTDNEFWYCYPTQNGIELYRSRSKPHIYQYTISLWGLRRIGEPETTTGVIGNPNKETPNEGVDDSAPDDTNDTVTADTLASRETDPDAVEEGDVSISGGANQDGDTQTQVDPTATISGGNAYVTKTMSPGTQADVTITTNTRTKTNSIIRDQSNTYAQDLAPLIGGHNGQLSPKTAYNCAKDLSISTTGSVLNIKGFDARTLNRDYTIRTDGRIKFHKLIEEVLFANLVSRETYLMQQQILDYSPEVLSPEYVLPIGSTPRERVMQAVERSTKLDSTLYRLITKYQPKYYLSKMDVKYLKLVMLETMMVYRQLYQIAESKGQITTSLTPNNMRTLIKNIDALVIYLETNLNDTNEFFVRNVMWELRKMEYILVQVAADIVEYV